MLNLLVALGHVAAFTQCCCSRPSSRKGRWLMDVLSSPKLRPNLIALLQKFTSMHVHDGSLIHSLSVLLSIPGREIKREHT